MTMGSADTHKNTLPLLYVPLQHSNTHTPLYHIRIQICILLYIIIPLCNRLLPHSTFCQYFLNSTPLQNYQPGISLHTYDISSQILSLQITLLMPHTQYLKVLFLKNLLRCLRSSTGYSYTTHS